MNKIRIIKPGARTEQAPPKKALELKPRTPDQAYKAIARLFGEKR